MMCPACNGIVGRDCFNPEECMAITQDQAARFRDQNDAECRLDQCEAALDQARAAIAELEERVSQMNAVLGEVRLTCRVPRDLYSKIDSVMMKEYRQ